MGVRSGRLFDVPTILRLERDSEASILTPLVMMRMPSAVALTILSSWRGVGQRTQTLVLSDEAGTRGYIQARARPGRESWDIVRLKCLAEDAALGEQACTELLDRITIATAQRGALRTFARLPSDSDHLAALAECGYRQYATELAHRGTLRALVATAPEPRSDVRVRSPHDAWDLFSLYCAVTPPFVRHAEGRSLREWATGHRVAGTTLRRWSRPREVLAGQPGDIQGWIRWELLRPAGPQVLEALVRPEYAERLDELLRFAVDHAGLNADYLTVCRVREYDGRISATLMGAGFEPILRETLLVRHAAARVTERQLLVAALRAQGLGIDISHYRAGPEAVHHRLASSREIERQRYDQFDRSDRASYYG
jgi:hypothetical protein